MFHRELDSLSAGSLASAMPKTSLLLVDDDRAQLLLFKALFEERGYGVLLAETGEQGVELARKARPDLILCDVIMPQFDGFRVLASLKADPVTQTIPVILLTFSPAMAAKLRADEPDPLTYLSKLDPFDSLVEQVETRLAGARALRLMPGQAQSPPE